MYMQICVQEKLKQVYIHELSEAIYMQTSVQRGTVPVYI